jgi:AcrR family transcriptional regulator
MHNLSMSAKPATLGLRERKKIKTRASLRAHAMRLFKEQGYNETSVEQIAEAAEVSPSTFFRYFPTKEEVVLADDIDPIVLQVLADQPADLPPMQAIRMAVAAVFEQLTPEDIDREVERQRLVYAVPELRQAMMTLLYRSIDMIASAIAARLGRSPEDFEVRVFAGAVAGAVLGGAVPSGAVAPEAGPDGTFDGAIKAIEFLAAGLPLT